MTIRIALLIICGFLGAAPLVMAAEPSPTKPAPVFRVAGYLPEWQMGSFKPEAAVGLTDLFLFSAETAADGTLDMSNLRRAPWDKLHAFQTDHHARLILCVGGWGRSEHFAAVATSPDLRKRFVESAITICRDRKLDGLDLDWEHPKNAEQEQGYADLIKALHEGFVPHGLVLSVTIAGWQKLPPAAFEHVDTVQVMAYDQGGRHSTLAGAQKDVKQLLTRDIPAEKIVLGLPFYGRGIKKRDTYLGYRELVAKHALTPDIDEVDEVYFNGPATLRRKTDYALEQGLGGVMIWEIGQDTDDGQLLRAIRDGVTKQGDR